MLRTDAICAKRYILFLGKYVGCAMQRVCDICIGNRRYNKSRCIRCPWSPRGAAGFSHGKNF